MDWELIALLARCFEVEAKPKELVLISKSRFTDPVDAFVEFKNEKRNIPFRPWVIIARVDPTDSTAYSRLCEAAACCLLSVQNAEEAR